MANPTQARLAALDFSREVQRLTRDFTGREWLFERIETWLGKPGGSFFLLTGEPGIGKSAIIARLAQTYKPAALHFCIAGRVETVRPSTVLRSLAAQLGQNLSGYGEALARTIDPVHLSVQVHQEINHLSGGQVTGVIIQNLHAPDPEQELDILVRAPFADLPEPPAPVLILIDALDEAAAYLGSRTLVDLLRNLEELPGWVRFLCTTRPERRVLSAFKPLRPVVLAAESQFNREDLDRYISTRVTAPILRKRLAIDSQESASLARRLSDLADGNFLYASVLLDDITAGRQALKDLADLPRGLEEIYHTFLRRFNEQDWTAHYQPVFTALVVARQALTQEQIAQFTSLPEDLIFQSLRVARQFMEVIPDESGVETYAIFHQSLRDFLIDKERNLDYWCSPSTGHQMVIRHYTDSPSTWDAYGIRHLPGHLAAAGDSKGQHRLLLDYAWLYAKLQAAGIESLFGDFELALNTQPGAMERGEQAAAEALRLVWEALHLSIHILARDPEQLPAQILGRLMSFSNEEIQRLLGGARAWRAFPWLRPRTPTLDPPGGALLRTLPHGGGFVKSLQVTPDGRYLVSHAGGETVKVFDANTWQEVLNLEIPRSDASALTPDGRFLVTSIGTKLNIQTGKIVRRGRESALESFTIAISPDGRRAATSPRYDFMEKNVINVWDIRTGEEVCRMAGHRKEVNALAFTPDGRYLVSASDDKTVRVWQASDGKGVFTLKGHRGEVKALAITPDGRYAVSGGWDDRLKVWDITNGRLVRTLASHRGITSLAVTPDGRHAISGGLDNNLKVWDLAIGKELQTLASHSHWIKAIAAMPDGRHVVSSSEDGMLKIWRLAYRDSSIPVARHASDVRAVAITPGGRYAISGADDSSIKVWDLATGGELRSAKYDLLGIRSLAITPDGRDVFASAGYFSLVILDLDSLYKKAEWKGHSLVTTVALSPDGRLAVTGSSDPKAKHKLIVWNARNGKQMRRLEANLYGIQSAAFTPDGRRLLTACSDGTLKVWDVQSWAEERTLTFHDATVPLYIRSVETVTPLPDGRHAASDSHGGIIRIWKVDSGQEVHSLRGSNRIVYAIVASPDGRWIISAGSDHILDVWDWQHEKLVTRFIGESDIKACAFAPDNHTIVAGEESGRVHFLQLEGV